MMQFLGTCYWQLSKSLGYLGQNLTFPEAAGGTYLHLAGKDQSYTYQVLQTIQIELILLCVWAEPAVLGSAKTTLKFKYRI